MRCCVRFTKRTSRAGFGQHRAIDSTVPMHHDATQEQQTNLTQWSTFCCWFILSSLLYGCSANKNRVSTEIQPQRSSATTVEPEFKQIGKQIAGSWIELNSDCETQIVFGAAGELTLHFPNSEARGSYTIKKAVSVPSREFCSLRECFEVEYELQTTKMTAGCSGVEYSSDDESSFMLFHFKDDNTLVYWTDIEFIRMQ